ncbi:MAG: 2-C-methyl-D-erythritol 2,4-cyclodiphosphate synthase [Deltaproteobacteria bacterium]|uniref:2-C-methyl-D-erythritol 2,4-cyclodiphosphate synthase n=1 Tax=Desulfobacula sp. TaxID=2593537 RepID=UPI0019A245B2|nr:2-C-methyl-D-erythritol 2,4-cyclodiphosphate synthase [Candidatus Desulfobacula maris]MBL6994212.1 2-C-methyl-D-erythritol 2,4-cyclodiphosphate synthase [Desulfobacula sp.]
MEKSGYKIGSGYDVHKLVSGRKLIIGGVDINFDRGLEGHSDADVLVHAVCDAILGAAGLGDIGDHFPDSDPQYKGISSIILLGKCGCLLKEQGFHIVNMDCIVFAQVPKISPHKRQMEENMARALNMDSTRVNVKATTTEKLGFIGKEQGIASQCTLLVKTGQPGI